MDPFETKDKAPTIKDDYERFFSLSFSGQSQVLQLHDKTVRIK